MNIFKIIRKYFGIFYKFIGNRVFIVFLLTIGAAITEGIGIALLLPLLGALEGNSLPDNKFSLVKLLQIEILSCKKVI